MKYYSGNEKKKNEMAGHVTRMGDRRDTYKIMAEKSERRKPLGRPRRNWEDNIKMDFPQVEWGHGIA
jgi:hypothetical protein